jgi:hypothetical protein
MPTSDNHTPLYEYCRLAWYTIWMSFSPPPTGSWEKWWEGRGGEEGGRGGRERKGRGERKGAKGKWPDGRGYGKRSWERGEMNRGNGRRQWGKEREEGETGKEWGKTWGKTSTLAICSVSRRSDFPRTDRVTFWPERNVHLTNRLPW